MNASEKRQRDGWPADDTDSPQQPSMPRPRPAPVSAPWPAGASRTLGGVRSIGTVRMAQPDLALAALASPQLADQSLSAPQRERFFSALPLALLLIDRRGRILKFNPAAAQVFGLGQPSAAEHFLLGLIGGGHAERVVWTLSTASVYGAAQCQQLRFVTQAIGSFSGDLHVSRMDGGDESNPQYVCAVFGAAATAEAAEAALAPPSDQALPGPQQHLTELRLATVINSALDAVICVDADYRILVFNPAAVVLFACVAEQALGSELARFLPQAASTLTTAALSQRAHLGEMAGLTADGQSLVLEVKASCERHPEGELTTLFVRDLSAAKRAEEQRRQLEAQLRQSQKMQAMGTLAGGIAHDFNNILSAILGNLELAMQETQAGSSTMVSLQEIEKAGQRARGLVRQILSFSRKEVPSLQPMNLVEVVRESVRLLSVSLPSGIALRQQVSEETPRVMADAIQVQQALLNLCANAIHAIGAAKGLVTIELGSAWPAPALCERLGLAPGRFVTLTVRDTGVGIDQPTLERIFEPFFTTKEIGEGTGLGLAVVHGIMRNHEGAIQVESSPGGGSAFTLYFPALTGAVPAATAASLQAREALPVEGRGRHVMYVDDDEALVYLVVRLLTRRGFKVSGFCEPALALQALRASPQDFDLLVTDYNMPGFSGLDLVREALLIRPQLPIALASGYVTAQMQREALACGARVVIHKPNDTQELCETVQRLIMGNDPLPAADGADPRLP